MLVPSPGQRKMHARIHGYVPAASDQRIRVYTSGIFDLFHAGHMRAIKLAAAHGTWLIVGVSSDESCAEYKRTPIIPYKQRREIVAACKYVDEVIEAPNYPDVAFYKNHRIDVAVQGEDTPGLNFYEVPKSLGIIKFVGYQDITSTSEIIKRIRRE